MRLYFKRFNLRLEFPNIRINSISLGETIITLEYIDPKFHVSSWHSQLGLVELTLQLYDPTQLHFEQ